MGSGKGKNKRAKAAHAPIAQNTPQGDIVFDELKWDEFVQSNLKGKNIYKYYLGTLPITVTDYEHEQVMTELFEDAVAVGALPLPSPYQAKDFAIRIRIAQHPEVFGAGLQANLFLIKESEAQANKFPIAYYLDNTEHNMDHKYVKYWLRQLRGAINLLLSTERAKNK